MAVADQVAEPTPPRARIGAIDAIRGLALFGIFAVNLEFMSRPIVSGGFQDSTGTANDIARLIVIGLLQAKSYLLFSYLFGYGLGLQMERSGSGFGRRYSRRMLGLLLLGLVHAFVLFPGDILMGYAVLGMALYLLRNVRAENLRVIAIVAFFVGGLLVTFVSFTAIVAGDVSADPDEVAAVIATYRDGPLSAMIDQRLVDVAFAQAAILLVQGPFALAFMLLGLLGARGRLLTDPAAHAARLRRWRTRYLIPGVVVGLLAAVLAVFGSPAGQGLALLVQMVAAPFASLGYLALFAYLFTSGRLPGLAGAAGSLGRMSLTIYLGQSLIATVLFIGFDLYGRLDAAPALLLALGVWLLLIPLTRLWWRAFRIGPMEWLLRSFTYWRRQPMRGSADDETPRPIL
jgi:uncharacterized protein